MTTNALMELADLPPLPQCWTGSPVSVVWSEDCEVTSREVFTDDQMHAYGMQCAELALRTAAAEGGDAACHRWLRNGEPVGPWTEGGPSDRQHEAATACAKAADWKPQYAYLHPPTDSGAGRDGWLSMDDAPKGGGADYTTDPNWVDPPPILLAFPGGGMAVGRWEWYYAEGGSGYVDGLDAWCEATSGEQLCLTHGNAIGWQPLPPGPDTAIAGAAGESDRG